jgi:hypothetical protein
MNKNSSKAITLLVVGCLATSCFVGSTLAKYTTRVTGSDTAKVAKFGVVLSADSNLFEAQYAGNDTVSVKSDDDADIIAPGTVGSAVLFTIAGAPEVDVNVKATLAGIAGDGLSIAKLPLGTYDDHTEVKDLNNDGVASEYATFEITEDYRPVKWTLKHNGVVKVTNGGVSLEDVNLDVIENYLKTELSGQYNVEDDSFDEINGDWELSWDWYFDNNVNAEFANDSADTYMGQIAAGVVTEPTDYEANETFNLYLEVTQVD